MVKDNSREGKVMNNKELKELIRENCCEEELDSIIVLEGDEFADGAIGISQDNRVVYSYWKLVESLMKNWNLEDETEAIEWLDYNTLRALPYMEADGKSPIILMTTF